MFLDAAADDRLVVLFELAALHGLRRGELCGATWEGFDEAAGVLTIRQQITGESAHWRIHSTPKTRAGRRKVDVDGATLAALVAHRLVQKQERDDVGVGWDNGTLPDEHGRPVHLSGLIFTRPDGRYLDPQWVTRHMWTVAKRAGLLGAVREPATSGSREIIVGYLGDAEPVGGWTAYVNRAPTAQVEVTAVDPMRGRRYRLLLAEPLAEGIPEGAEIGRGLLSRRRLHDLRHGSASIQLAAGVDLTLISKRLGHSSPAATASMYAHLTRSAGRNAAEAIAAAIPRSARGGHLVGTEPPTAENSTTA